MPTLIVDLHCMCLWAPDEAGRSVHVLMPDMSGDDHHHSDNGARQPASRSPRAQAAQLSQKHVVRMLHRSFTTDPLGRPMEGWALVLSGHGPANVGLDPFPGSKTELPNLSTLTGRKVSRSLVTSNRPAGVISRVSFGAGAKVLYASDPFRWTLGRVKDRVLANHVTWVIPNVPDQLNWVSLGATGNPPLRALSDVQPESGDLYRISIHHETERTLPGGGGPPLTVKEMRLHFAAFYGLLGISPLPDPAKDLDLFPDRQGGGGGGVLCRSAMALLDG